MNITLLKTKLRKASAQFPYLPRALKLVWKAAPHRTVAWALLLLVQGILPAATVYLTKAIVDSLTEVVSGGGSDWEQIRPSVLYISLMGAVLLASELLRSLNRWVRTALSEEVRDYISDLIHTQSARLDMAYYETPAYYDRLHRALSDARFRPVTLLENIGSVAQNSITMAAMVVILASFTLWLPLALLISAIPIFIVLAQYTLRQYQWQIKTTADERRSWYYSHLLTDRAAAAEIRLFDLSEHYRAAYQTLRGRLRNERLKLTRDQGVSEIVAGIASLLIMVGVLGWMLVGAAQGRYTLGDLALFYQAFNQGQKLMRSLMENMSQIYSNSLFLGDLFEFLALESVVATKTNPTSAPAALQKEIVLRDVVFNYPGSQRVALNHFNLTIPAGKVIAIVGSNGAGKSTLVKLLCRFYDPKNGRITFDGIDLRDMPLQAVRRLITVVFQQPVQYSVTAARNITLGDLTANPTAADIEKAAVAAGADAPIARLSQGYETMLGKWFGGAELSVGEWQRLALARAFLRRAELIILDEPTSAMDSWAETDWLNRFRDLAGGKTAVVITHRFTTAMRADTIHVMDRGRIVESGTHEELLALNGRYAQSWQEQTKQVKQL